MTVLFVRQTKCRSHFDSTRHVFINNIERLIILTYRDTSSTFASTTASLAYRRGFMSLDTISIIPIVIWYKSDCTFMNLIIHVELCKKCNPNLNPSRFVLP